MSLFKYPTLITEYAEYPESNINWVSNSSDFLVGGDDSWLRNLQTARTLTHIPNPTRGPKLDKTYYLKCTNFNLSGIPEDFTGISLTLVTQRNGRIVDDTISLIYQDEVIGKNKTDLSSIVEGHIKNNNTQVYGGVGDYWEATITPEMLQDPSFGVLLRFSSNPLYPHNTGMIVYKILLSVHVPEQTVTPEIITSFGLELTPDAYFVTETSNTTYFIPE